MKMRSHLKRLFVDFPLCAAIKKKATKNQYHYLAHVMRMKDGENILLFNGENGEWLSNITYVGKDIVFEIVSQNKPQTKKSNLHYIFSPIKTNRLEYMIQKSVEMGIGTLHPVVTQYTQNTHCNMDRMRSYAISAAEQCNTLTLPSINPLIKLDCLLKNWDHNHQIVFADETCYQNDSLAKLQNISHIPHIAILVGPEGGYHPKEKEKLHSLPFITPISLGPRILRSDTAAVATMALVQSICGDWY
ncbi:16S rRNA (uracil(1498)-N(3))-methyltransferase [Candidatus Liberibacter africanus]|uniref:Ribosomal RNA small subunit methyltransferase E n=1 Tax=Candidatus Liberibacter africanus PTSAPSY TaxID=1277257 RepID=A0A0G3I3T1_LIBAF|nr:16S rRNA (uracil(1498)-N(3))-methyltransferase [Candidatus Liberibacter africanus]AKK20524.1 16S rRNA m3U1498 methyltransferase [Candidatus Liberibacter africanus PTSAPSY]QTP64231.1 16S rRNA (uracil(1498)-N(3))-methyltransferase [Candidatus Liberibacter africanus]